MKQSHMLFRLEIKRAMKKLPRLILGAAIIFAVVAIIVVIGAASQKSTGNAGITRVALVTNNNSLVENVGMELLGNMETVSNLFDFNVYEEEEALKKFDNEELEGVIIFPDNYVDNVGRGDNDPAQVIVRNEGTSYSLSMIAEVANAAGNLLTATEAANYSLQDWGKEYGIEDRWTMSEELGVTDARIILQREDMFEKVTLYGEDDVTFAQSYFCSAMVILILLWGLSCGTILKSDPVVFTKKLSANLVSTGKQQLIKLTALVSLLGTMFAIIGALLLVGYAVAPGVFELMDIESVWQIVMLLISFIPAVLLAATIVMLAYTIASNQIGGILLLFISTIVMGYISGCLVLSVYLPETLRDLAKYLPTTYMHEQAQNALVGIVDAKCIGIMLTFSITFFVMSVAITKHKENRV